MVIDREYFSKYKDSEYYLRGKMGDELDSFGEYEAVCVIKIEDGYRIRIPVNMKGELQQIYVVDGDFPITDGIRQKADKLIECLSDEFFK